MVCLFIARVDYTVYQRLLPRISGILPQGGVGAFGHLEIEPKPLEELTIMDQAQTDPILSWASGRVVRQRFQGDRVWKRSLPTLDMLVGREVMSPPKWEALRWRRSNPIRVDRASETDHPSGKMCVSGEYDQTRSNMWVWGGTTAKSDVHPNVDSTWSF